MTLMRKFMDILSISECNIEAEKHNKNISNLNKIYNGTLKKRKEEIIARDLLSTIGLCSSKSLCDESKQYLQKDPSRIEICIYSASLCIPPENNNELYLVAHAFQWAGAKYRKEAIKYLKEYISNGAVSDYIESHISSEKGYSYNQRTKFIAIEHTNLATLLSQEYRFEDAISELYIALNIAPYLISIYPSISQNYIKLGDYDNALSVLYSAQKSKYYKLDQNFKTIIDNSIKNTNKKRETGYIYRPRKKSS